MNKNIRFMALGGGQSAGASCYYLKLGSSNILLDCGIGSIGSLRFGAPARLVPVMSPLWEYGMLDSLSQLSQIYISHAHMDHIGYLPEIMNMTKVPVYMTDVTAALGQYQINGKLFKDLSSISRRARSNAPYCFDRITRVDYAQSIYFPNYTTSFYPAGHIPGAMMTCFDFDGRKILYTGDYSLHSTPLTDGCILPREKIDTLIICGLHAKNHLAKRDNDAFRDKLLSILLMSQKHSVYCRVRQLSKGMECLKALNSCIKETGLSSEIYLDQAIMEVIVYMEKIGVPMLEANNHAVKPNSMAHPHIIIGTQPPSCIPKNYHVCDLDFTLHDDYQETVDFIKKINPRQAVVVHCSDKYSGQTIEQKLMCDPECKTQFIFPENGFLYNL